MSDRIDELAELHLDGALAPDEAAELRRLVEADPAARARFVTAVRFSVRLGARLHRPPVALAERVEALLASRDDGARVAAAVVSRLPTTRIRAVSTRIRRRRAGRGWLAALTGLAAALLLASGLAWLQLGRLGAEAGAEADGRAVAAGARLRGAQTLRFADGTALVLAADAELELGSLAPKRLRLLAGALAAEVAPQPAGAPLAIATPQAEAIVVGTAFRLETGAAGTRLAVSRGLVRLAAEGRSVDVAAGREAVAGGGRLALAGPPTADPDRLLPSAGRPFGATSPWNAPIAAGAKADPLSPAMSRRLAAATSEWMGGASLALYRFAIPVLDAGGPPRRIVAQQSGSSPFAGATVRIPERARASPGNGSLVVIDWQARRTWEFWRFAWNGAAVDCAWGGSLALDGDGCEGSGPGHAGISLLAGLIRTREIAAGRIPHALVFASNQAGRAFRFPARQSDGSDPASDAIPVGARIQLDPAVDLAAIPGITPGELAIGRALQEFGAYCVGRSEDRIQVFAELAADARGPAEPGAVYTAAGLDRDAFAMPHLPWDALRVLK